MITIVKREPRPTRAERRLSSVSYKKLDQVIALLGTISGQLGAQAKPAPAVKAERTAPAPQREAPQGVAVHNGDPRFVTISGDADGLIVSMTEQRASLEDIVAALNAAGYRTATGQEWTRSRCRDHQQCADQDRADHLHGRHGHDGDQHHQGRAEAAAQLLA